MKILLVLFLLQEATPEQSWMADPRWSFGEVLIGAISLLVATIIALLIFYLQKTKSKITYTFDYEPISNTLVQGVNKATDSNEKLKILFDDKPVSNISLVNFVITNSGTETIGEEDFVEPINIFFGEKSVILSGSGYTEPSDINAKLIRKDDSNIEVSPTMLNPKDSINYNFLVNRFSGDIRVTGRIKKVKEITKKSKPTPVNPNPPINTIFLCLFLIPSAIERVKEGVWSSIWGAFFIGEIILNFVYLAFYLPYHANSDEKRFRFLSVKEFWIVKLILFLIVLIIVFTLKIYNIIPKSN